MISHIPFETEWIDGVQFLERFWPLTAEREAEVLPNLRNIFLGENETLESVWEVMQPFVDVQEETMQRNYYYKVKLILN
jgi:hypothetical protein